MTRARARRVSMTAIVTVCLLSSHLNDTLFASEAGSSEGSVETTGVSSLMNSQKGLVGVGIDVTTIRELLESAAPQPKPAFAAAMTRADVVATQVYPGPPYPYPHRHRRDGSIAAIVVGAAAAITGGAVLAYANRPECSANALAGGCGYGTKVVGTAVLSGGLVSVFVGALTWR